MKAVKIILIIILVIGLILGILALLLSNFAKADEYKFGSDTIKSVYAVVGERKVISSIAEVKDGITTKIVGYESDSVTEDLQKYVEYLRGDGDFSLTTDMSLLVSPSSFELAKESNDSGKVIMLKIEYDSTSYTLTFTKGVGTFEML